MSFSPLSITNFITADGAPVAEGELLIRLSKDCMSPEGQVSTRTMTFDLDDNGSPGDPLFWPNASLNPADSTYWFQVRNGNGEIILQWQGIYVGPGGGGGSGFGSGFGTF
jgi:hypothetical protein